MEVKDVVEPELASKLLNQIHLQRSIYLNEVCELIRDESHGEMF
jgi:hypothetical protein